MVNFDVLFWVIMTFLGSQFIAGGFLMARGTYLRHAENHQENVRARR